MTVAPAEIERFLRTCLRLHLDPTGREAVLAAARGLTDDWEAVGAVIDSERIGPLLHQTAGPIVAPLVAEQLHLSYHATALRNLLLLRELGRCLRALTTAAVPVIVLKGGALTETVYENVALRPMGDVDLLVRERDLAATRRTLDGLGYEARRIETHPGAVSGDAPQLIGQRAHRHLAEVDLVDRLAKAKRVELKVALQRQMHAPYRDAERSQAELVRHP